MVGVLAFFALWSFPMACAQTETGADEPAAAAGQADIPPIVPNADTPEIIELRGLVNKTNQYPIDLESVLKLVEEQNLPLQQSKVDTDISQARVRQRQAAFLPSIDGTFNQSRFEGGTQVFGGETFTVVRTTVNPQIGASWTLYPGGRTIYELLAAKRRKAASDIQMKETYQQQLSRAAEEYYQLLAAQRQKNVVLSSMRQVEEQVKLNEAKLKAGNGTKLDLMRAKASLAQQKRQLTEAETGIVQAEQRLLNRLNLEPNIHLITNALDEAQNQLIPLDSSLDKLTAEALENHPALKRFQEELVALGIDYKVIRSDFFPALTLRANVSGTGPNWNAIERGNFRGLSLNVNLLENMGLAIPFRLREKRGEIERKMLEGRQLVRDIESQVTTAFLNSRNYAAAIEAAEEEIQASREAYRLAFGRYKAGYGINLDVLDAEVALTTARTNLAQAMYNFNQAQIQLVEALGKTSPASLLSGVPINVSTHAAP